MSSTDEIRSGLVAWQDALKKRDELQELLQALRLLVQDGSIRTSSVAEVSELLAAAQKQVDQLQTSVLAP